MVKNIYILNSQLKVIKVLNINGDNVFYDDTYKYRIQSRIACPRRMSQLICLSVTYIPPLLSC